MKNIQNIYISGLIVGLVILGMSTFYTGILYGSGLEQGAIGEFNITDQIYEESAELQSSTENITASETDNVDRAANFIGGMFQTVKIPFKSTLVFGRIITKLGEEAGVPQLDIVLKMIMLIVGIVLTIDFMKFVRGISG